MSSMGMGGGVGGGAAAGAAAGTAVLPGWGTLIGAGLGAVGGFLGSQGGSGGPSDSQLEHFARMNQYNDEQYLYGGMARKLAAIMGPEKARQVLKGTISAQAYDRLFGRASARHDRSDIVDQIKAAEQRLAPYRAGNGNGWNDRKAREAGINTAQEDANLAALREQLMGGSVGAEIKAIEQRLAPFRAERGNGIDDRAAAAAGVNVQQELSRLRELNTMLSYGIDPGQTGTIDSAAFDQMGPGVLGDYQALAAKAEQQGKTALKGYGADTARLMEMARGIESGAQQFGQQERARINTDADRALTSANRLTEGRLIGRGLGASTTLTQGLQSNARAMEEQRQNALGSLGDRQIQMLNQLRGNTMGLAGQRMGGKTSLLLGNQDRTLGYQQQALGVQTNALTAGDMNPWLSRSMGSYVPGMAPSSPSSSATWGNFLTGLGGQVTNLSLMELLRRQGVGGSGGAGG